MTNRIEPKRLYPGLAKTEDEAILLCGLDWCWNPLHAMGYCLRHYNVALYDKPFLDDPNRKVAEKPKCAFDPCENAASARGHCPTHYNQLVSGRSLTPIKPRKKRTDPKRPGKRNCAECDQWKDADEFYASSNGGKQSKCKPCIIRYNAAWAQKRKLAKQGVDVG